MSHSFHLHNRSRHKCGSGTIWPRVRSFFVGKLNLSKIFLIFSNIIFCLIACYVVFLFLSRFPCYKHMIEKTFSLIPAEVALHLLQWLDNQAILNSSDLNPFLYWKSLSLALISYYIICISKLPPKLMITMFITILSFLPKFYSHDIGVYRSWILLHTVSSMRNHLLLCYIPVRC